MTRPIRIVIDGNIGSGKTTQLALLEKKGWKVRREPIESWPLEKFYADPKRWAFYFHMVILQTLRPVNSTVPVVYERSLLSSRWVFWPVLQKKGFVTDEEDATYAKYYEHYAWYPDLYIFLSKDLDLAWEHIQKRGQTGDSGVTREYLEELQTEYMGLVKSVPCKVRVVNANGSIEEIHSEICRIIEENELFIGNGVGDEVQEKGGPGRQMSCPPFQDLCRVS
jgi:deoxyadenosine/deoxycytidine kinase